MKKTFTKIAIYTRSSHSNQLETEEFLLCGLHPDHQPAERDHLLLIRQTLSVLQQSL